MFLNCQGHRLSLAGITKRLGDYVRLAGIQKRGSCHSFRHSAATLMLKGGADIRHIQELLGHRSLDTTQIYTRVSPSISKTSTPAPTQLQSSLEIQPRTTGIEPAALKIDTSEKPITKP